MISNVPLATANAHNRAPCHEANKENKKARLKRTTSLEKTKPLSKQQGFVSNLRPYKRPV